MKKVTIICQFCNKKIIEKIEETELDIKREFIMKGLCEDCMRKKKIELLHEFSLHYKRIK